MSSAQKLQASGADFMICPSNTPHDIYDDVVNRLPIPWLHIVPPVRRAAHISKARRVLLLGTRFTLEGDFYDKRFRGSDLEIVRTDAQETANIHEIINRELIKGIVTPSSQQYLSLVMSKYASMGVDGVILGCTELPLIISSSMTKLALFDSATLLADAALDRAIDAKAEES